MQEPLSVQAFAHFSASAEPSPSLKISSTPVTVARGSASASPAGPVMGQAEKHAPQVVQALTISSTREARASSKLAGCTANSRLIYGAQDSISAAPMDKPLSSRIALVTGASRGIGYAIALALARSGAHVVAVARTVGGLEELDDAIRQAGGSATLVPLDLADLEGLARLGAALHERYGKLDVLVGNAGVLGPASPLGHIEPKEWNDVMTINVTANFQLIRCMEPLLRASDAGRAVFISSGAAGLARAYIGPYGVSKAALELLVRTWANEIAITPIRANLFNPGPIRTRMRAALMPGEDPMTLDTPEQVAEFVVPMCLPSWIENGRLYYYPTRSLLSFRAPA